MILNQVLSILLVNVGLRVDGQRHTVGVLVDLIEKIFDLVDLLRVI